MENLCGLVADLNQGTNSIIDVGAGKGYISQILDYYYDKSVLNLECESAHNEGAKNRSKDIQYRLWKQKQKAIKVLPIRFFFNRNLNIFMQNYFYYIL